MPAESPRTEPVRVWDLPTRAFHWVLAASVIGSVITAKVGGNALAWHFRLGYVAMTLLLFRLVWGLVGGRWSRFASFVRGPGTLLRYLRGDVRESEHLEVGHSPIGALSVLAMLALLVAQVATGLVADDEIASTGPLNKFVSSATASTATHWHKDFGQALLILLVVLHVGAIAFYHFKRGRNLVWPMWNGDKTLPAGTPAALDSSATRVAALVVVLGAAALVAWVVQLGG